MQCYSLIYVNQNWVPCGRCNFCLQNRRNDWAFRLLWERKVRHTADFLTFTYDNENVPLEWEDDMIIGLTLRKKELYTLHETIKTSQRRLLKKEYADWKIRYYSVGEYGSKTDRPHYHSIMFNLHPETKAKLLDGMMWSKGRIYTGTVTPGSVSYVAKYVIDKKIEYRDEWPTWKEKPFNSMSRNPGIGANYLESNKNWHRENDSYNPDEFRIYAMQDGKKVRLPRYYKDKIFKKIDEDFQDVMKTSLELHYMDLAEEFEKTYIDEIERLALTYENPVEQYNLRRKQHHDRIRIKSLNLNRI